MSNRRRPAMPAGITEYVWKIVDPFTLDIWMEKAAA